MKKAKIVLMICLEANSMAEFDFLMDFQKAMYA